VQGEAAVVDDSVATLPAVELAAGIRSRKFTSRELLELYLDRVDRLNPPINAVVTLDADRARTAADAADAALARGDDVGPLHGLPVTIKDAIETEGIRSTGGAVELTDHVPTEDAPAVARLKEAGAIVFGKTNAPRWSGDIETFNEIFGGSNNPWNVDHITGGSSGGSAAAVAAGLTSFELGTDIGGSVRIPSHCCGVFGLKPSFGVVPQRGYLDQVGGGTTDADVNVFGPIARSADDLDLLINVLASPAPEHAPAWRIELPPSDKQALDEFRIGVWFDTPESPLDAEYRTMLGATADALSDAGAKVDDGHPPVDFGEQVALFYRMVGAATSVSAPDDVGEASAGSHHSWLRADKQRAQLRRVWAEWFEDYDLLLCPVLAVPPFRHHREGPIMERTIEVGGESRSLVSTIAWPGFIGVVGLPSAVAPIGRTAAGLPVGMQLVSPYLHDRRSVQAAKLVGELTGGYQVPPGF
jgi:amidase